MSVRIHGKDYTEVKDRIKEFRTKFPDWSISTDLVWHSDDMNKVLFKATILSPTPKDTSNVYAAPQKFTGWAFEGYVDVVSEVNNSSWVENCETSAIGRALANMDILTLTSATPSTTPRPTAEEMAKVEKVKVAAETKQAKAETPKVPFVTLVESIGKEINDSTGEDFYGKLLKVSGYEKAGDIKTRTSQEDFYKNVHGFRELIKSQLAPYRRVDESSGEAKKIERLSELSKEEADVILKQLHLISSI